MWCGREIAADAGLPGESCARHVGIDFSPNYPGGQVTSIAASPWKS
jgi:hypothetical protein